MGAGLEQFDELIESGSDLKELPAKWLTNGFFTLTFPDESHKTFRIRTEQNGKFKGRRTISLLIGPDNTSDYEPFSFVEEEGPKVWKRFQNQRQAQYAQIVWDIAQGEPIEGYELKISKRCLACNRPLTTKQSIELNYGPNCRERLGL